VIKQLGIVATALAAGLAAFGGVASATSVTVAGQPVDKTDQFGLLNLHDLDTLHSVNVVGSACDDEVNVLGVQVPLHDVGQFDGESPDNCAGGTISDGGTALGH
jgi:hypothetical protein